MNRERKRLEEMRDSRNAALDRAEKAEAELEEWEKGHKVWLGDNFGEDLESLYNHLVAERDMWKMKCAENDIMPELLEQAEAEAKSGWGLAETIMRAMGQPDYADLDFEVERMVAENKRLREALEFYANGGPSSRIEMISFAMDALEQVEVVK